MGFLISLVPTLIVLGVLILIHEYGHFLACRMTGVKVEKFSIGFGPEVLHWQGRETRFVLALLPLGGYVKPAGEQESEVESEKGPEEGDYLAAPLGSRIFIVCAGVIMNYLLAVVLFAAVFMMGRPIPGTTIGSFVDGYPASESRLRAEDRIIRIGGTDVQTWNELTEAIEDSGPGPLDLVVLRSDPDGDRKIIIPVTPRVEDIKNIFGEPVTVKRLGITPHPEANQFERFGPVQSVIKGVETTGSMAALTYKAIFYMVLGKMSLKTMAGPIGIVSMTGSAAKLGLPYVLQLAATLSVSLAVINLLPIPALDGGHLLFLLIEGIRRKPVSLSAQEKAAQTGFILLMILMVFIIYNDLVNLDFFGRILGWFNRG